MNYVSSAGREQYLCDAWSLCYGEAETPVFSFWMLPLQAEPFVDSRVWIRAEHCQDLRLVKNTRFLAADEVGTTHEPLLSFCHSVFFCAYCHFESSEPPPICLCVFLSAANREGFFLLMSQFAAVTTVRLTVCSGAKVNFSH